MAELGVVDALFVYPVKSFAGIPLDDTKIGWHGLADDRRFAFLKVEDRSGLPWLSARDVPGLLGYRTQPYARLNSSVLIERPCGAPVRLDSPELLMELEAAAGCKLQLVQLWRGAFDSMPVSILTTASIASLGVLLGREIETERFRPNIVVRASESGGFPEEKWVHRSILIGKGAEKLMLRVNRKDQRCHIVNVDPRTRAEDTTVLSVIVHQRKNQFGIYGSVEFPGPIRLGDELRVRD